MLGKSDHQKKRKEKKKCLLFIVLLASNSGFSLFSFYIAFFFFFLNLISNMNLRQNQTEIVDGKVSRELSGFWFCLFFQVILDSTLRNSQDLKSILFIDNVFSCSFW